MNAVNVKLVPSTERAPKKPVKTLPIPGGRRENEKATPGPFAQAAQRQRPQTATEKLLDGVRRALEKK